MTDVYNRGAFDRDSIQSPPDGYANNAGNALLRFLGSFWRNIHEGLPFVKGIQKVRGIKAAQFYLDLLESLKLQDRKGAPVFHRELWKPLIIRKSKRNTAQENILKVGVDAILGPQGEGSRYGEGTVLQIGSLADLDKYVTYPVDADIEVIGSSITDNVIEPKVSYKVGSVFPGNDGEVVYVNGTLIFPKELDPFGDSSPFEVYDVVEDVSAPAGTDLNDQETVLWASDVLVDRNHIADHLAYAVGIDSPSTEVVKRVINAGWDAIGCGLTPELFRTLLAALSNIPVVQEEVETVRKVIVPEDGTDKTVVTDANTYTVHSTAKLRKSVVLGAKLRRGEFLDESVKVYPLLTDVSKDRLRKITEYADILEEDVPVITLPNTFLRTKTANGIAVEWTPTELVDDGDGYPYFAVDGSDEDVLAFWKGVWASAEDGGIDLSSLLNECAEVSETGVRMISPAKFFLKYLIGANTLIVTIDDSQIADTSILRDARFFDLVNKVLPSGMRLFFIEHKRIDGEDDEYGLDDEVGAPDYSAEDEAKPSVLVDADDEVDYSELPGMRGKRVPTYEDEVGMKMYRKRKRSEV